MFNVGEKLYIRTVTHHHVGEVVEVISVGQVSFVILRNASWVADSGRWCNALRDGFDSQAEIEPCTGLVRVNIGSIIDVFDWSHPLPTLQQ